mmetsp:Transcript_14179/g.29411  ORF Transcript_14179/g.29411 Transcript_14179/m.29411 type:complete len:204 (+) Transcript_14179:116-727(+)
MHFRGLALLLARLPAAVEAVFVQGHLELLEGRVLSEVIVPAWMNPDALRFGPDDVLEAFLPDDRILARQIVLGDLFTLLQLALEFLPLPRLRGKGIFLAVEVLAQSLHLQRQLALVLVGSARILSNVLVQGVMHLCDLRPQPVVLLRAGGHHLLQPLQLDLLATLHTCSSVSLGRGISLEGLETLQKLTTRGSGDMVGAPLVE